jgi:hypothetical protein
MAAVVKAKGMVRHNIVNGVSNGLAAAGATAIGTLGTFSFGYALKSHLINKYSALGLMCVVS